ncbi:MAG: DUF5946 family protein, partial [Sphingomicrobium sp.]
MDSRFIHQHVVDAYLAGEGCAEQKPMGIWFALIGLCLHLEHGLDGRHVQRVHMELAKQRRDWPRLEGRLPVHGVTVEDVAATEP